MMIKFPVVTGKPVDEINRKSGAMFVLNSDEI